MWDTKFIIGDIVRKSVIGGKPSIGVVVEVPGKHQSVAIVDWIDNPEGLESNQVHNLEAFVIGNALNSINNHVRVVSTENTVV